jgi:hypothetical protein
MGELATQQTTSMQALVPRSVPEAVQLAETLAKSSLIPEHLQNKPGDCLLVVMQAQRWGMDALSVAQCTSVVHKRLCYEGKLVAAVLYSMGAIDGRLHYEITGSGAGASIKVTGVPRGGNGEPQTVTGAVKEWRTYGKDKAGNRVDNAWDKIPEDMLVYRGTRQWARRYAPEALLGIYTPDEFDDEPATATATVVQMPTAKAAATPTPAATPTAAPAEDATFSDPKAKAKPEADKPAVDVKTLPEGLHNLSDSQAAILKARAQSVGLDEKALIAKYHRIDLSNLNAVLAELREMANNKANAA